MSLLIKALEQAAHGQRTPSRPGFVEGAGVARMLAQLRGNPVMMVAAVAVLFGVAFGVYVYAETAKPGVLARQSVRAHPQPVEKATQAVAEATKEPPDPSNTASDPQASGAAAVSAHPEKASAQRSDMSAHTKSTADVPPQTEDATSPAASRPAGMLIPASAVIASSRRDETAQTPPQPAPRSERTSSRRSVESAPATPPELPPAATSGQREQIAVSPATGMSRVNPHVSDGYASLQAGNVAAARASYSRAIDAEPLNIDALLGLAYVCVQENRSDEAMKTYLRILQLNPRHALAQAALIGLMGRADPAASETRLKQLMSREPSAFLHFVLGNLYSDQSLWNPAQQAYFQAHHLEPDNPDYAYNLAVALDHLRQGRLALEFYRRAEHLTSVKGRANFGLPDVRARIGSLSASLE